MTSVSAWIVVGDGRGGRVRRDVDVRDGVLEIDGGAVVETRSSAVKIYKYTEY